jgi:hypothetical protein
MQRMTQLWSNQSGFQWVGPEPIKRMHRPNLESLSQQQWVSESVSVNSVNIVRSVNKVVNPHKDNYHYVGGSPHTSKEVDLEKYRVKTKYMLPSRH